MSDWGSGGLMSRPPVNSSLGIGTVDEEPSVTLAAGTTTLVDPGNSVAAEFTVRVEDV